MSVVGGDWQDARVRARVIVVAGPSGSGKSRLAERLGLPVLRLDDFYRSAGDPALPRDAEGLVDWDDPRSWLHDEACAALERLCRGGSADVPEYDIARDGRVGLRILTVDGHDLVVAEGIFAQEVVG
ncbi:MAG: uridine kinase, partial [Nocardioidaceae bacterium]|nr:uridine kinase [Nocardioidaceae bacterium]